MLNFLTKSAIRRKILLLFVYNKEKEFFLSEIARQVKTSAGTAQRELNRLRAIDFITFKKKGNLNLYRLNPAFPLLEEIEAIVRKTAGIEVELKNALQRVGDISFAFIFGSYAEGGMRSGSDIDLFLIGRPDEDEIYRAVTEVEDTGQQGDPLSYHERRGFRPKGHNGVLREERGGRTPDARGKGR
jgi:predicted nucleotidyltransferase